MKKIMILGGGENQLPLIERAKVLGYYVVLCDFRDNVPGIELSDVHYQVNTLNPEEVITVGKNEQVDGIVTNSEPAFIAMAKVANVLGLKSMSIKDAELYKNKYLMREFCKEHNILYPAYRCCTHLQDALDFYKHIEKKCIIKPLDNSASRGVYSINSEEDLVLLFNDCLSCSSASNPAVLIEEYVTGTEFTVDGLVTPSGHKCLAISQKKHYTYNENVAYELLFDNENIKFDYSQLREVNDKLVNMTGIQFGLTHAEYKFMDGNFYLIEIQARGGGNFIATDIVPFISGIDSYTELIKWAVGDDFNNSIYDYHKLSDRCSVLYFFDAPGEGGVVKEIRGLDFFEEIKDKMTYELYFKEGDYILPAKDDSKRIGWYILKCENRSELDSLMNKINNEFKIIY